jgi:integrase
MWSTQPSGADRRLPRGHLLVLNRSFRRTLEAENKSPGPSRPTPMLSGCSPLTARRTPSRSSPGSSSESTSRASSPTSWKPATAHNRYRGLHAFFEWMVAEGDLETNPMERMRPPQLPEQPGEVVGPEHLARLLKTCEGRGFASRRDTAIILLLVDTGMRRAECAGMTLDDVDLDQRIVWVLGKGRRPRRCRSAAGPPRHSTGTYGPEKSTGWRTCRGSGLAATGP